MFIFKKIFLLLFVLFTLFCSALDAKGVVKDIAYFTFDENEPDVTLTTIVMPSAKKIKEISAKYENYFVTLQGDTSCGDNYERYASNVEDVLMNAGVPAHNIHLLYYRKKGGGSDCTKSRSVAIQLHLMHLINHDNDDDGVLNALDKCPNTPINTKVNSVGCAFSTEVILLNGRKKHTAIIVTTSKGLVRIDKPLVAVTVSANDTISKPKKLTQNQVEAITGAIYKTSNKKQYRFVFYFNKLNLVAKSKKELQNFLTKLSSLQNPYINIIGNTDTIGTVENNKVLGLKRAQKIAAIIDASHIKYLKMDLSSNSELNLAVPTPDETGEPRNRRVEVLVQ